MNNLLQKIKQWSKPKNKVFVKEITLNFRKFERQSKIRKLFNIPLPKITYQKDYWF